MMAGSGGRGSCATASGFEAATAGWADGATVGTAGFARVTESPTGDDAVGCGDAVGSRPLNDKTSLTSSPRLSCTSGRSRETSGSSLGDIFANSAEGAISFVG